MIRIGIIGCGKIAQVRHIPEYLKQKDVKLTGFYDMNHERAGQLAQKYHARAYDSCEELLDAPEIDAVSVCTANATHAQISMQALRAGKHVLCEKPMAVTMKDCVQMVETAKETGKYLMIAQNQRLTKAHRKAKEMVDAGEIGKLLTFRTTFGHGGPETWSVDAGKNTWFFDEKRAAMGAMADLGVHKTDLIRYLASADVETVTAKLFTTDKRDADGNLIRVDDNAVCIYQLTGGITGTMTASWTYYGAEDNSTILYGTEGILRIYDDPSAALVLIKKDGEVQKFDVEPIQTNDHQTDSGVVKAFTESIRDRKEPEISGAAVLNSMQAVFAAKRSSEEERTVFLKGED